MAGIPATVRALSALSQSARAGSTVGEPPSVIVEDVDGFPVPGFSVTIAVTGGGGSVIPASLQTDINGTAEATSWTLGATPGTNTLEVTAGSLSGSPLVFSAEGTPAPASSIEANSATSQSATVGSAVAAPPSVLVKDTAGVGKGGITVLASVLSGQGQISETSLVTDGSGVATLGSWILGTTAGAQSVQLSVAGLTGNPIVFTATATPGALAALVAVSPVSQVGQISSPVGSPPAARAQDGFGNPIAGQPVAFTATVGGGSVLPATAVVTGSTGVASSSSWTLGASPGSNEATATAGALPPLTFLATGQNPATTMVPASATSQNAGTSTNVADPPAVLITGSGGVPVEGVPVDFAITAGGGSLDVTQVLTGVDGLARAGRWTLGSVPGANTVTATVSGLTGSPQTFSATGLTLTATQVEAASATSQDVIVSSAVTDRPAVRVRDASGLPVAGRSVDFASTAGGGSISPASVNTDANGIARATSWTAGATVGADVNQATATATGLAGSPITFRASGVPGPAASMTAASALTQTGSVGTAVGSPPAVTVRDVAGNPVPNHPVTFTRTQGVNGSIAPSSPAAVMTNASGIAALSRWSLGTNPGVNTDEVVASTPGLTAVVFRASAQAGGAIPVPAGPRARFERIELATDLACLGGLVIGDVLGVIEATVDHRFDGLVRVRRLTVRFLRRAWPGVSALRAGRVLRVVRRDGDFDEYRAASVTLASTGDGVGTVEAQDPILDFGDRSGLLTTVTGGVPALSVTAQRRTIANLLAELLIPNASRPEQWGLGVTPAGVVDTTFAKATSLAALVAGVTQVNEATASTHEISARRNGTTNYLIDIAVVGAAAPVPDVRTGKNLLGIEITRDPSEQATRLYPVDGSGRTLDDNAWLVTAVATNVSIEVASTEGGTGPSLELDQLAGFGWEDAAGTVHPITGSVVVSDTTTRLLMASTTGILVNDWGRLTADSAGTGVSFLALPSLSASEGAIAKEFPSTVPHVTNWARNPVFGRSADGVAPDDWVLSVGVWAGNTKVRLSGLHSFGGSRSVEFLTAVASPFVQQARTIFLRGPATVTYSVWHKLTQTGVVGINLRTRDPVDGSLDSMNLAVSPIGEWIRTDVSYAVTTAGMKSVEVGVKADNLGGAPEIPFFLGVAQITISPAVDFIAGSGSATSWQRSLTRLQTHGTPLVTVKGSIADLTGHDPSSWPDDQLHHGGLVDVTDTEIEEVFSARLVALTEDLLNPEKSVLTIATQPRLLSTVLGSTT